MIKTVFDGHSIGKQWFQIHRAILVLVPVLTLTAFILILVDRKGVFSGSNHAIIGTTVFVLAMIQPIMGMLRPGLDSKWRIWFGAGTDNYFFSLSRPSVLMNCIQTIKSK